MPWVFGLVLKWHDNSEVSLLGDGSAKNHWPNEILELSHEFPSRCLRKSEESRARIAVDQEIEATSSLKDLINPNQSRENVEDGVWNVPIPHLYHLRAVRTCSFVSVSLHICLPCFQTGPCAQDHSSNVWLHMLAQDLSFAEHVTIHISINKTTHSQSRMVVNIVAEHRCDESDANQDVLEPAALSQFASRLSDVKEMTTDLINKLQSEALPEGQPQARSR